MSDDCVCTNLMAIHSVLSDIASSLKYGSSGIASVNNNQIRFIANQIVALTTSIGTLNDVVSKLDSLFSCNNNSIACILNTGLNYSVTGRSWFEVLHTDLTTLNGRFVFDDKNIAEVWSYKDFSSLNEIIVESQMWSYVGRGEVGFNDLE